MQTPKIPDAAESNAGDDFHILWAMRKALELLNFSTEGLKALSVEGVTKADESISNRDAFLGVDLTEYYGGKDFKEASSIIISQLKYSTRTPDKNWTVSTLCKGKKHLWKGSILNRLANAFNAFYKKEPRADVIKKLSLKIVSNRPASPDILSVLSSAQQNLSKNRHTGKLAAATAGMRAGEIDVLKKIAIGSGLKGIAFEDFLMLLDLSDCGTDSRFGQKQKLIDAIALTGNVEVRNEYRKLFELVNDKTLPEGRAQNTITASDIVLMFGFPDISDLFPVRSSLQLPDRLITRTQVPDIVAKIVKGDNPLSVIHGAAGIGKSTITELVKQRINTDSCVIVFDCYGSGSYLDSEDKRHKHENAFLQLSNELSMRCGTPFLLTRSLSNDNFLKEFRRRLVFAAQIVRNVNKAAQVVIIIDAADNSAYGAKGDGEDSFVDSLLRMSIPDGCRIVVTSRTERINLLKLPDDYTSININPFSFEETKSLLLAYYPSLKDNQIEAFRSLTAGTPRVMAYALEMPGKTVAEKLQRLRPRGKTIDLIFKAMIREAKRRSGNEDAVKSFLQYLIHLPRPVPMRYLAIATGLSEALLMDTHTDLWKGIMFSGTYFSFRDEDFENFLRKEYPRDNVINSRIADIFLDNASADDYASTHLGMSLNNASRHSALQEIVLERRYLDYPRDPIKNKEVEVERTRLAMKASSNKKNNLNSLKLQIVAAQAAKTNDVLERILLENAELASSYGNLQMNQRFYFQEGNPGWFGAVHFKSAAVYSRSADTHNLAMRHLEKADAWMEYRRRLPKEKREEFSISAQDISYATEAVLRIKGPARSIEWLGSWQPKSFIYEVAEILLNRLLETTPASTINRWLKDIDVPVQYLLLINRVCFEHGIKHRIDIKKILQAYSLIEQSIKKAEKTSFKNLIAFCEYCLTAGVSYDEIRPWLNLIEVQPPDHVPLFNDGYYSHDMAEEKYLMDVMFRKACIVAKFENKELKVSDFYPESLIKESENKDYNKRQYADERIRKFRSIYAHFLGIYKTRLEFILKSGPVSKRIPQLKAVLNAVHKDYEISYLHRLDHKYILRFMAIRMADVTIGKYSPEFVDMIIDAFSTKTDDNILLQLALAKKISTKRAYDLKVLELLKNVEQTIDNSTLQGSDQLGHFTNAAIIASRVSPEAGKYYFDKMVLSSAAIDVEGQQQIRSIHKLISSEQLWNDPKMAFDLARFVEYCYESIKGYDHFPWREGIAAICRLDAATSLALACRLDHRNVRALSEDFTELITEALDQGFINHVQAASLLPINPYIWPGLIDLVKKIFDGFDHEQDHSGKDLLARSIVQNMRTNFTIDHSFKTLDAFWVLIKDGRFISKDTVDGFKEYHKKIAELLKKDDKEENEPTQRSRKKRDHDFAKLIKKQDVFSATAINQLVEKLKNGNEYGYVDFEAFFDEMRRKVQPEARLQHLDVLIALNPEVYSYYSYEQGLTNSLVNWDIYPDVREWKKNAFLVFLRDKFPHYVLGGHVDVNGLKKMAALFNVDEISLAEHVLQALPIFLDELEAATLYQLMDITSVLLSKEEKKELVTWILPRWSEKIKDDLGDGPWDNKFLLPQDSDFVLAHYLRYILGHPAKGVRWKGAHALRQFAAFNCKGVLEHLLQNQNNFSCGIFQDTDLIFYWLSSKLYLWIAIDRIAKEHPGFLYPYVHFILQELNDSNLPHTLIQKFAKSAGLALAESNKVLFNPVESKAIKKSLNYKKIARKKRRNKTYSRDKLKFEFDSLDTIPYWYDPLAAVLGCSTGELLDKADDFISHQWGYSGDGRTGDPAFSHEWSDTSNRGGSEPNVENLRHYFEFHAMFCAAGELLKTVEVPSDPEEEGWEDWLEGWTLCWDKFWLSDLRDPVPLLPKLWYNKRSENWQWDVGIKDFDELLGLSDQHNKDVFPIKFRSVIRYGTEYENCSVTSTLVDLKYGPSLLLSLQTARKLDPYVPLEKEEYDYDSRNMDPRFKLKGWIMNITSGREGIDDTDKQFQKITKSRLVIGSKFTKWAKLKFTDDYRFSYQNEDPEDWITRLECWNSGENERRYDGFSTEGERLFIKKKLLLNFLKETNQSLIAVCEIDRHVERRDRFEYYDPYCYIYLINPDGKIETITRTHQLR